jgi:hypothetical protein
MSTLWLAAEYHFPSTYSCRIPMSSMSSASAMPAPGPATVRLALIRTGIEYIGIEAMRDTFFPDLCSVPIRIVHLNGSLSPLSISARTNGRRARQRNAL